MHMVATNVCVWSASTISETAEDFRTNVGKAVKSNITQRAEGEWKSSSPAGWECLADAGNHLKTGSKICYLNA